MAGELSGQTAVVTGGGRGLGRAIAEALAAAGAAVAVTARSQDQLDETVAAIRGAGGRAIGIAADIADRQAVERLVAETERQLGPIDLLVNNAGTSGPGPYHQTDFDVWWRMVETNLRGPMLCTWVALPGMIARRHGRIINMASPAALRPSLFMPVYGSTKAALLRFTDCLALETKEHGVSVFAISPGLVHTAMTERLWRIRDRPELPERFTEMFPEDIRNADEWLPAEWTARLCVFLASGRGDALSGRFIRSIDDVAHLVERAEEIKREGLYILRVPALDGLEP